jgi:hypothetical protein
VAERIFEEFPLKVAPYSGRDWAKISGTKNSGDAVAFAWQLAVSLETVVDPAIKARIDAIEASRPSPDSQHRH